MLRPARIFFACSLSTSIPPFVQAFLPANGRTLENHSYKQSQNSMYICPRNLLSPLFSKEGKYLPLAKGGQEGFSK
jgi:hypothetical protein